MNEQASDKAIVFYDGDCALCSGLVRWLVEHDRHRRLLYAPQGGSTIRKFYSEEQIAAWDGSVIVRAPDGTIRRRSAASIYMLRQIGGIWSLAGSLMWLVPAPLRNAVYEVVQRHRYKWFGKTQQTCPVASTELRQWFLD